MTASAPNLLAESGLPIGYPTGSGGAIDQPPEPVAGRVTTRAVVRSLTVMQKEATVATTRSDGRWRLASDEGPYLAGHDYAPAPLAHMTVGFATDLYAGVRKALEDRGSETRLTLDTYFSMEGSMRARTMTGGAGSPTVTVHTPNADSADTVAAVRSSVDQSITAALAREIKTSRFTLTSHGRPIPTGRVSAADGATPKDPGAEAEMPSPGTVDAPIIVKTMDVVENPSDAGASLQDRQSRGLHIRADVGLREDRMVEVELQLISPNGSTFTFLSEEPAADGSPGRAPDSLTYMSAGLGFCFMTQIGRFAKIVKQDLGAYHIVQDLDFGLARDGQPATVGDPVTHVYLNPDGDDDFAREALDMSEQTCFLHAFCRTALEPELQVVGG